MIVLKKVLFFVILFFSCFNFCSASTTSAHEYVLMDMKSGRVLKGKDYNSPVLIASITKIMSCLLAVESKKLDEVVVVSDIIKKSYGSGIYIEVGEEITLRDLLYGLMLRSGNDAALMVAEYVGGDVDTFVSMMNQKAKEIGMLHTTFVNPSGLDNTDSGNYSTAYDMALLTRYAMQYEDYRKIVGTKKHVVKTNKKTYVWHNKNKLLDSYEYCIGGKTGFTKKSRRTLVTAASREEKTLVVVTLNDPDDFADHKALYEKNFKKYNLVKVLDKNSFKIDTQGTYDQVYLKNDLKVLLTSDEEKNIKINYDLVKKDSYEDNETVGSVVVKLKGKVIAKEDILARKNEKIQENFWRKVLDFLMFWN